LAQGVRLCFTGYGGFGITGWRIYRDTDNPNAAMVHFMVDDIGKAMDFLSHPNSKKPTKWLRSTNANFISPRKNNL
jgi:hypothetical protein